MHIPAQTEHSIPVYCICAFVIFQNVEFEKRKAKNEKREEKNETRLPAATNTCPLEAGNIER